MPHNYLSQSKTQYYDFLGIFVNRSKMNWYQIFGFAVTLIGTAVSFYGSYLQVKGDSQFQSDVKTFVTKKNSEDIPVIKLLGIKPSGSGSYVLVVKNVGNKPAADVNIFFTKNSSPTAFQSGFVTRVKEIPNGVEYDLPLDFF